MSQTGVIDRMLEVYTQHIDSGFGLLGGEVAYLSTTLVAIDMTLAALFWAWAQDDVTARLVKKVLYVGFFAFLIGNFHALGLIVLKSFSGLGLKASGAALSAEDFLRPGQLAALGVSACKPILEAASELGGFPGFFENIVQIVILLAVALLVIVAFFVIAVQIFVVLIEFKLATLAGFVLVPFALFGRTAFLAERVLGHVIACGVKVMVLAVIVGIGTTLFSEFTQQASGQPTLEEVLAMALAALTLLGLSIFGPGVASGLVSGAPQLGAGAAVGTGLTVAGMAMVGAGAAQMAAGGASQALAAAGAGGPGGPRPGPGAGSEPGSGSGPGPGLGTGPGGPPPTKGPGPGGGAAKDAGAAAQASPSGEPGSQTPSAASGEAGPVPTWARDLKRQQALAHGASLVAHGLASGDDHGAGASPSLSEQS